MDGVKCTGDVEEDDAHSAACRLGLVTMGWLKQVRDGIYNSKPNDKQTEVGPGKFSFVSSDGPIKKSLQDFHDV